MSNEDPFGAVGKQLEAYRKHQFAVHRVTERISTLVRELEVLKLQDDLPLRASIQISFPMPGHRVEPKTVEITRWTERVYDPETDEYGLETLDRTVLDAILPIVIAMKEAEVAEVTEVLSDLLARYQ